jgi:hypothetical protein
MNIRFLIPIICLCLWGQIGFSQTRPSISVKDFGAIGDGTTKDTIAFQKALDTCAVNGGGDVLVPAGKFLIGSVQMGQRTILRLDKDAVIVGSPDADDYPMMDIRWEGRWQPGRRALIYASNVDHIGIVGPGRIEGNPGVAQPQNPRGVVVLEPINCNDVLWQDFSLTQGGNWATHPTYCTDVIIKNINIRGGRDGIDIDSCKNVRIEGCTVDTGDDSISLKSGRGMDGARIGKPVEDVLITNCTLNGRSFACIGIGSETSGGVRNIRMIPGDLHQNPHRPGRIQRRHLRRRHRRSGRRIPAHQPHQQRQPEHRRRPGPGPDRLSIGEESELLKHPPHQRHPRRRRDGDRPGETDRGPLPDQHHRHRPQRDFNAAHSQRDAA